MKAVCLIYQAWQHHHYELSLKKSQACCSQMHNEHLAAVKAVWDKFQRA